MNYLAVAAIAVVAAVVVNVVMEKWWARRAEHTVVGEHEDLREKVLSGERTVTEAFEEIAADAVKVGRHRR